MINFPRGRYVLAFEMNLRQNVEITITFNIVITPLTCKIWKPKCFKQSHCFNYGSMTCSSDKETAETYCKTKTQPTNSLSTTIYKNEKQIHSCIWIRKKMFTTFFTYMSLEYKIGIYYIYTYSES